MSCSTLGLAEVNELVGDDSALLGLSWCCCSCACTTSRVQPRVHIDSCDGVDGADTTLDEHDATGSIDGIDGRAPPRQILISQHIRPSLGPAWGIVCVS